MTEDSRSQHLDTHAPRRSMLRSTPKDEGDDESPVEVSGTSEAEDTESWATDDSWSEYMDWQQRYGNMTEKLKEVFPSVDKNGDSQVSLDELRLWHYTVGHNATIRRTRREFEASDQDGNGKVSLKEYLADTLD